MLIYESLAVATRYWPDETFGLRSEEKVSEGFDHTVEEINEVRWHGW